MQTIATLRASLWAAEKATYLYVYLSKYIYILSIYLSSLIIYLYISLCLSHADYRHAASLAVGRREGNI